MADRNVCIIYYRLPPSGWPFACYLTGSIEAVKETHTVEILHRYFVASFPYYNGTSSIYICIRNSVE